MSSSSSSKTQEGFSLNEIYIYASTCDKLKILDVSTRGATENSTDEQLLKIITFNIQVIFDKQPEYVPFWIGIQDLINATDYRKPNFQDYIEHYFQTSRKFSLNPKSKDQIIRAYMFHKEREKTQLLQGQMQMSYQLGFQNALSSTINAARDISSPQQFQSPIIGFGGSGTMVTNIIQQQSANPLKYNEAISTSFSDQSSVKVTSPQAIQAENRQSSKLRQKKINERQGQEKSEAGNKNPTKTIGLSTDFSAYQLTKMAEIIGKESKNQQPRYVSGNSKQQNSLVSQKPKIVMNQIKQMKMIQKGNSNQEEEKDHTTSELIALSLKMDEQKQYSFSQCGNYFNKNKKKLILGPSDSNGWPFVSKITDKHFYRSQPLNSSILLDPLLVSLNNIMGFAFYNSREIFSIFYSLAMRKGIEDLITDIDKQKRIPIEGAHGLIFDGKCLNPYELKQVFRSPSQNSPRLNDYGIHHRQILTLDVLTMKGQCLEKYSKSVLLLDLQTFHNNTSEQHLFVSKRKQLGQFAIQSAAMPSENKDLELMVLPMCLVDQLFGSEHPKSNNVQRIDIYVVEQIKDESKAVNLQRQLLDICKGKIKHQLDECIQRYLLLSGNDQQNPICIDSAASNKIQNVQHLGQLTSQNPQKQQQNHEFCQQQQQQDDNLVSKEKNNENRRKSNSSKGRKSNAKKRNFKNAFPQIEGQQQASIEYHSQAMMSQAKLKKKNLKKVEEALDMQMNKIQESLTKKKGYIEEYQNEYDQIQTEITEITKKFDEGQLNKIRFNCKKTLLVNNQANVAQVMQKYQQDVSSLEEKLKKISEKHAKSMKDLEVLNNLENALDEAVQLFGKRALYGSQDEKDVENDENPFGINDQKSEKKNLSQDSIACNLKQTMANRKSMFDVQDSPSSQRISLNDEEKEEEEEKMKLLSPSPLKRQKINDGGRAASSENPQEQNLKQSENDGDQTDYDEESDGSYDSDDDDEDHSQIKKNGSKANDIKSNAMVIESPKVDQGEQPQVGSAEQPKLQNDLHDLNDSYQANNEVQAEKQLEDVPQQEKQVVIRDLSHYESPTQPNVIRNIEEIDDDD